MLLTLIFRKKMYSLQLPEKVAGQFYFKDEDIVKSDRRILIVDSDVNSNSWIIKSSKNVKVYDNEREVLKQIKLENNELYLLSIGGENAERAFLFTESLSEDRKTYTKYMLKEPQEISIGTLEDNNIIVKNNYISGHHAKIVYNGEKWLLCPFAKTNGVYVNRKRIETEYQLNPGDTVFVLGVKIVIGGTFFAINNPGQSVEVCSDKLTSFVKADEDVYELEYDDSEEYYYRSPHFRRENQPLKIKIDAPPQKEKIEKTPILLTLAPAMLMGMASLASGVITTINTVNNNGNIMSTIPTLLMSVSLLCGMIVFPLIMKKRDNRIKKETETERKEKYTKYLNIINDEINKAAKLQKEILEENNPSILQMIEKKEFWDFGIWQKSKDRNDFLSFRLGLGEVPIDVELTFPESRFSIDDDELRKKLELFKDSERVLKNVPLCISLLENRVLGIVGTMSEVENQLHNLLMQIALLHSYDEVKVVFLCDEKDINTFSYVKAMPHIWDNEEKVRFLATNEENVRELSMQLNKVIIHHRENKITCPYYVVISASKVMTDKCGAINEFLVDEELRNFMFVAAYDEMKNLPKECKNVINLAVGKGTYFENDGNLVKEVEFVQDIVEPKKAAKAVGLVSNYRLDLQQGKFALPEMLTFLDMFKVGKKDHLNILQRWKDNNPVNSLRTPIGIDTNGETFYLDLHEKYHGPHGLVAGMTGSGKSEFIITFILSLAVNYSPNEVAFVLIDYKGGGLSEVFDNDRNKLPHLAGTITNLDGASIARSLLSIKSELRRRQAVFNKARAIANEGTMDIYKYQKMFRAGMVDEPIPHLFIISDEFAELKSQQPEFMEQLISTARIGRSLGVHLILATQKPSGVVNEQIWANSKFKICLKVQERADSMDMLKRPEAAELVETGRFYLQVGYNEMFELGQSAWCGAPYIESDNSDQIYDESIEFVDVLGNVFEKEKICKQTKSNADGKQIIKILEHISEISQEEKLQAKQLWLPEISEEILLADVRNKYAWNNNNILSAIIGEYDDPACQRQDALCVDFVNSGNMVIYGCAGSGKDLFLSTLLYSLYQDYSADRLQTYLLDFGAEILRAFEKAPQTGDVCVEGDDEKIDSLIKMLKKEMENRKKIFIEYGGDYQSYYKSVEQPVPCIVIVINNYTQFAENYQKHEEQLISFTRDCTKYGIYFVVTSVTSNGIRHRMVQNFLNTFVLQLSDKTEYMSVLGSTSGVYPSKIQGRGIFKTEDTYEYQIAHITNDANALNQCIKSFCNDLREKCTYEAKRIPLMPKFLTPDRWHKYVFDESMVPVGLEGNDYGELCWNFKQNPILQVLAQDGEEYISYLRGMAQLLSKDKSVKVTVFDTDNSFENSTDYTKVSSSFDAEVVKLFNIVRDRNNDYKATNGKPTINMEPMFYIFRSYATMKKILTEDSYDKLKVLLEKTSGNYNVYFIIGDDYQSCNRYFTEEWYSSQCKVGGIWIGSGITDQVRMVINRQKSSNLYRECNETDGFFVKKGVAVYTKFISAIGSDLECVES